ncbi:MAG TPA: MBL fold metallo-hydrolase [Candidatus Limnocylindria bacterium]|nr:MBL fold metallo-hydrolase [Candidatus Limnocylindria bacterium]
MELRILGCDGSYPGPNGACSSYLAEDGDTALLLDLGCGALPRLMAHRDPASLAGVVITHWHFDHASDVLGLQYYLLLHKKRLTVYSPGEEHPLKSLLSREQFDLLDLEGAPSIGGFRVKALRVDHPTPACAVRLEAGGKSVVYTGDTASRGGLMEFCAGTDLLVCDAAFTSAQWHEKAPHMSAAQAGALARDCGAKRLVLTHFPPGSDRETLLAEGQAQFPGAVAASPGLTVRV